MRATLDEIELDIKELRCLMEMTPHKPELTGIAQRRIREICKRLHTLEESLNSTIIPCKEEQPVHVPIEIVSSFVETAAVSVVTSSTLALGDRLKPAADLSKSFSLNDSFRFSRELFEGDSERMNNMLREIGQMDSMEKVMALLSSHPDMDTSEENAAFIDFVELLKKYFV